MAEKRMIEEQSALMREVSEALPHMSAEQKIFIRGFVTGVREIMRAKQERESMENETPPKNIDRYGLKKEA